MSIERTLRGLETVQARLEADTLRDEKALAEYRLQSEKPFEHMERLNDLLTEQTRLNAALDLDKDDKQATTADNDNDNITADTPERNDNDNEILDVVLSM